MFFCPFARLVVRTLHLLSTMYSIFSFTSFGTSGSIAEWSVPLNIWNNLFTSINFHHSTATYTLCCHLSQLSFILTNDFGHGPLTSCVFCLWCQLCPGKPHKVLITVAVILHWRSKPVACLACTVTAFWVGSVQSSSLSTSTSASG